MKFILSCILISLLPFKALSLSSKNLSKKLNFTRGVYKIQKGSGSSCISGKFEIFAADGKAFHMKASGNIFASNIHTKQTISKDSLCKIKYSTKMIKSGFVNVETMECIEPDLYYRRTLMLRSNGKSMEYSMKTKSSKKAKVKTTKCKLRLISKR